MSTKSESINLKDAFAYMNFLNQQLRLTSSLLNEGNERFEITSLTANCSYIMTKLIVRKFSQVNPELNDTESLVEKTLDYDITADELIAFLEILRAERERCALAISAAKKQLPRDLDLEITLNKERHEIIGKYRELLSKRNAKADLMDQSYKFDNDGRQTVYNVPATLYATLEFDRDEVRRRSEELSKTAKEVSCWIDRTLVTTEVDFVPTWDVNDSFEDMVKSAAR